MTILCDLGVLSFRYSMAVSPPVTVGPPVMGPAVAMGPPVRGAPVRGSEVSLVQGLVDKGGHTGKKRDTEKKMETTI